MPKPPMPQVIVDLLVRANPAVIGTVRPDGAPVTVATWYLWDEGRILVNMDAQRRRLSYLRANPKVSLTVLDPDDRFVHISMQGLIELTDDSDLSGIDRLAKHYIGEPYPDRERPRVNGWIEIEHWHEWGLLGERPRR
ncbi:MAG: PPOX class F420-dependent oxidoreductase [Actinomycetota bacterium]|nr:PPOX class F420-dependent oxidoreductase [Actinomycetota bacterium]